MKKIDRRGALAGLMAAAAAAAVRPSSTTARPSEGPAEPREFDREASGFDEIVGVVVKRGDDAIDRAIEFSQKAPPRSFLVWCFAPDAAAEMRQWSWVAPGQERAYLEPYGEMLHSRPCPAREDDGHTREYALFLAVEHRDQLVRRAHFIGGSHYTGRSYGLPVRIVEI